MELQLSKASLNNQIVTMRHIVRKSKVYTINKLLREANKLKEKKGNEEQILKNKKKAERFVNELLVIKKLNNDVVSKYALQNEVPTATILNYTDITLETRALARLAGHKFIVDAVQSFRIKYPDWKSCLIDLLSVLGTKFRVKKKSKQQKSIKVKAKCLKKNDRTIETTEFENAQSECDIESKIFKTNSDESNISLQNTKIEISHINTMLPIENDISMDKDKNIEFKPINSNIIIAKEKNHSDINVKPSHTEKINVFEIQTPTLKSQTPDKNSNSLTNLQINMIEDIKFDKSPKKKHKQSVSIKVDYNNKRKMSDEIKPICETVDSFFMTTDDKDYMSVYKPPAVVERSFEKPPKPEYQKPRKDVFIKGKKVVSSKQNAFGNRRERRQQQVEEPIDTSLHPSWEAKRKQKSLAKFEGKKITFDDQD